MSFSLDFTNVFAQANILVNSLFNIYSIPLGISLAMGILGLVVAAVKGIFKK